MAKSILKDNHTQPIEGSSQFVQLRSQSQTQSTTQANRRVSFAREVTLHKIDYIQNPNNKRRKTIAGDEIQSSQERRLSLGEISKGSFLDTDGGSNSEDEGGTRMISDSSEEEEEEAEHRNLEVVGDIVDDSDDEGVNHVQEDVESEDDKTMDLTDTLKEARETMRRMEEDQDDEQTMELTGTIPRQAAASTEKVGVGFQIFDVPAGTDQVIDEGDSDDSIKFIKQSILAEPANWVSDPVLKSEPVAEKNVPDSQDGDNEDDTQPMELTQTLPKTVSNTIEKPVLKDITEEEHSHSDSEIDEMADELENDMRDIENDGNPDIEESGDKVAIEEGDGLESQLFHHNDLSEHMDLTLVDVKKINLDEPTNYTDDNEISMAMDLTIIQPRRELLRESATGTALTTVKESNEESMSKVDNVESISNQEEHDSSLDADEEGSMELTQSVPNYVQKSQTEDHGEEEEGDHEDDDDEMQLTTAFPKKVDVPVENIPENSQPMDLTQTTPKTVTEADFETNDEGQEEEEEEPMELTQAIPKQVNESVALQQPTAAETGSFEQASGVDKKVQEDEKEGATNILEQKEDDQEIPMDLTQPLHIRIVPPSENPNSMKQVSQTDDEESTMELTTSRVQIDKDHPVDEVMSSQNEQFVKSDNSIEPSQAMDISQSSITEDTSHIEQVVTTTIPLAEITQDEDDQIQEEGDYYEDEEDANYVPVTLSDFFNDIGVQFYDDLELDITSITRSSMTGTTEVPTMEDYIKSRPQLGLLELYEFCCQELNKNIINGREIYGDFEKNIEINNPALFKKYYKLDEKDKLLTNIKLQLIRDYARLQSKKTWYSWRSQLIESLISQLDVDIENMESDKKRLTSAIEQVNEMYDMARQNLIQLQKKFNELISSPTEGDSVPVAELRKLKDEVSRAKQDILNFNIDRTEKEEELSDVKGSWNTSIDLKSELQSNLQELQTSQEVDNQELRNIFEKYKTIQELSELTHDGSKITFMFDKSLLVEFDFAYNNINYTIEANNFKNQILMQSAVNFPINPNDKITDQFKKFSQFWSCLKKIDFDLYYANLKYPIEISITDDSIELVINYYNFTDGYELQLLGNLKINDLLTYQQSIKFQGKSKRKNIHENFRNQLIKDLDIFPTLHSLQLVQ